MTDQLDKWKSSFGDDYTTRNQLDDNNIQQRANFWNVILMHMAGSLPKTILEIGAGVGGNLAALSIIYNNLQLPIELMAIEPNLKAKEQLKNLQNTKIIEKDIFSIDAPNYNFDMVFTCGVLIHIEPIDLKQAMEEIYRVTKKYIVCAEYFSPTYDEINYMGQGNMLWKGDFGSYWLDNVPLRCVGYGFSWKKMSGLDNLTWQIFEKVN